MCISFPRLAWQVGVAAACGVRGGEEGATVEEGYWLVAPPVVLPPAMCAPVLGILPWIWHAPLLLARW